MISSSFLTRKSGNSGMTSETSMQPVLQIIAGRTRGKKNLIAATTKLIAAIVERGSLHRTNWSTSFHERDKARQRNDKSRVIERHLGKY